MARFQFSGSVRIGLFAAVCLLLVLQASAYRLVSIDERSLPIPGLKTLPMQIGSWKAGGEQSLDAGIAEYLRPDEYILRDYIAGGRAATVNLFIAYFRSLEKTYGPHAPRICLPGSGWLETSAQVTRVPVPGPLGTIPVNEMVYEKSGGRILVLYWYQNSRNIWAEEFQAKLRLLPDLIRYRRSDVSLVRVIVPLQGSVPGTELTDSLRFTELLFPQLTDRLGASK
ncbi:MAG: EpsI family protein [Acidobacteriia bacterium]|nr:EpsI family protein [Terriglobia bacterium]